MIINLKESVKKYYKGIQSFEYNILRYEAMFCESKCSHIKKYW